MGKGHEQIAVSKGKSNKGVGDLEAQMTNSAKEPKLGAVKQTIRPGFQESVEEPLIECCGGLIVVSVHRTH